MVGEAYKQLISPREPYKPLVDEPGKAQNGKRKSSAQSEPPPPGCFDKYKGFVAAVFLSVLTASLFLLRSGPLASGTCSNIIMILCEAVKLVVALSFVISAGQVPRLGQSLPLAFVPVTSYVCVNLLSFWALKYVHASLGALMSQIKLPATAVFSRIFLGRIITFDRTMALITIFFGALAIAAYGQEEREDEEPVLSSSVSMLTYTLATLALLGESCLSAATGVFTQWVFAGAFDTLWVRNAQFGFLSIIQCAPRALATGAAHA